MLKFTATMFVLLWWGVNSFAQKRASEYVNLFICTSGDHGQLDPSATVPFGMIKLGPDTDPENHSGYDYEATKIAGFSHNRIGGVGCTGAGGNLRILPAIGELNSKSQSIRKKTEIATPCYYSVTFSNKIKAELTATNQTGFHRYTFPSSDQSYLMVDFASSFGGTISSLERNVNNHEFTVRVAAKNVCGIGRYIVNYHVWCNKDLSRYTEKENKLFVQFSTKENEEVLLQVTASTISEDDARQEWLSETKDLSFDEVKQNGTTRWEKLLSKIKVEGKEEYKTIFYTHLYHLFLNPVKTENRNKLFRASSGQIVKSENYTHYDCWSMWDSFRNKFSLYPLLIPEITSDIAHSLVDLYKYGKPYWSGYNESVPTVRTEHSIIALLDFYQRGITDFDIEPVYNKMGTEITNMFDKTPDTKLEQSYDYWALAQFAKTLGKEADYHLYLQKSNEYKIVWKARFQHMDENSDIMHGDGLYEGTLWQYRWHTQFDVEGTIEMMGGNANYTKDLEYFFDNHLYNHGNEPDIHAPFMFNFVGKPWLTQKWVNKILTKDMFQYYGTHEKWGKPYFGHIYKDSPEGYIPEMDDDEGAMSGWYVLASMGLYPVLVGDPVFQLSTPVFDKVTIELPNSKEFIIRTSGLNDQNFYIQSASLNGNVFNQTFISQDDIVSGGLLEFNVSDLPNKEWGTNNK